MKKLITLLAIITLLSCEKEEELNPINGEINIVVENVFDYPDYSWKSSPYQFNYVELTVNGVTIIDNNINVYYSSDRSIIIKAVNTGYDMNIKIYYNGTLILYKEGYMEININEVLYNEDIKL